MRYLTLLAVLLATPSVAGELRTGVAAFGDWHGDAPEVTRRITPADLPPPYATQSAAAPSVIVARPDGAQPKAPPGFAVSLFASGLQGPRTLRTAPDGSVFVAEVGADRVLRFTPDGKYSVFATGLDSPFGIAFWPQAAPRFVYIAETGRVQRYPWTPGAAAPSGPSQVILADLPTGGHWTRDLAVAPDDSRLFVSVGSDSNVARLDGEPPGGVAAWQAAYGLGAGWGDETGRAAVLTFAPDGGDLRPYAQGLRNCSGLAVQPGSGIPWCVTNERDGLGDNLPPDFAAGLHEGAFYGWPWFYIGNHPEPRVHGARADLAGNVTLPDVLFQPHSAPLSITFITGDSFPSGWHGDAFVAMHGSWNRSRPTGYKVVRLPLPDGHSDGSYQDFLTGFVLHDGRAWGRPVGVTMAGDGALLVSEDEGGTIWRVAPQH